MSKKPIYKPIDPAVVALSEAEKRGDPAKWGVNEDNLRLAANSEVTVEGETRTKVKRVMRWDVFRLLWIRHGISDAALASVRRLQEDIAILHRTHGASDAIRTIGSTSTPEGLSLARREAGERIREVMAGMRPKPAKLILALTEREAIDGVIPDWRAIVKHATGQHNRQGQADQVRQACEALAESYKTLDNRPRRATA